MRNTSLSRVGAERTRTHVVATANSQAPESGTATLGGAEGFGGTIAGSTGVAATTGAFTVGAGGVATGLATAGVGVRASSLR